MVRSLPHPAGMRLPRPHPVFVHRWATPRVIALVILIRCSGSDGTVPLWAAELALHTLYAARAQHRKRADCDSAHDRPPLPGCRVDNPHGRTFPPFGAFSTNVARGPHWGGSARKAE